MVWNVFLKKSKFLVFPLAESRGNIERGESLSRFASRFRDPHVQRTRPDLKEDFPSSIVFRYTKIAFNDVLSPPKQQIKDSIVFPWFLSSHDCTNNMVYVRIASCW